MEIKMGLKSERHKQLRKEVRKERGTKTRRSVDGIFARGQGTCVCVIYPRTRNPLNYGTSRWYGLIIRRLCRWYYIFVQDSHHTRVDVEDTNTGENG